MTLAESIGSFLFCSVLTTLVGNEVDKTLLHTVVKIGDKKYIAYMKDENILWKVPYSVSERKIGNSLRIERHGLPAESPYNRILIRKKGANKK